MIHRSSMGIDGLDKAYKSRSAAAIHANYIGARTTSFARNGSGEQQATWFIKTLLNSPNHPKSVLLVTMLNTYMEPTRLIRRCLKSLIV